MLENIRQFFDKDIHIPNPFKKQKKIGEFTSKGKEWAELKSTLTIDNNQIQGIKNIQCISGHYGTLSGYSSWSPDAPWDIDNPPLIIAGSPAAKEEAIAKYKKQYEEYCDKLAEQGEIDEASKLLSRLQDVEYNVIDVRTLSGGYINPTGKV